MIVCAFDRENLRMECAGHAGYAEPGKDIVCAMASILMDTLAIQAQILDADADGDCVHAELGRGIVRIEADERKMSREARRTLLGQMDFAARGMEILAQKYPENVQFVQG